jgi:hypothetical protein
MWFGLLYEKPPPGEEDVAYALVYEPQRIFTGGGPLGGGLTTFCWAFRQAAAEIGGAEPPRCPHCAALLDVPPLDDMEPACASS